MSVIVYVNSTDIEAISKKVTEIEERFWINYRYYQKENRDYLERCFDEIHKQLDEMKHEKQMEMEI